MRYLLFFLLLSTTPLLAQRGDARPDLTAELGLSPEQQAAIAIIRTEARARFKTARADGQRPDQATRQANREAVREQIQAILTPEQQTQLAALRQEAKDRRRGVRADLKTHRQEKIEPVLQEIRARFDAVLSSEDRASLARLREALRPAKRDRAAERPTPEQRAERRAAWRAEHAADLAELDGLTVKYATELEKIRQELRPQKERWRAERRAIRQGGKDIPQAVPGGKRSGRFGGNNRPLSAGARFLLMKA